MDNDSHLGKVVPLGLPKPPSGLVPKYYKTFKAIKCRYPTGTCRWGVLCVYAHGEHELRPTGFGPTPEEAELARIDIPSLLIDWWKDVRIQYAALFQQAADLTSKPAATKPRSTVSTPAPTPADLNPAPAPPKTLPEQVGVVVASLSDLMQACTLNSTSSASSRDGTDPTTKPALILTARQGHMLQTAQQQAQELNGRVRDMADELVALGLQQQEVVSVHVGPPQAAAAHAALLEAQRLALEQEFLQLAPHVKQMNSLLKKLSKLEVTIRPAPAGMTRPHASSSNSSSHTQLMKGPGAGGSQQSLPFPVIARAGQQAAADSPDASGAAAAAARHAAAAQEAKRRAAADKAAQRAAELAAHAAEQKRAEAAAAAEERKAEAAARAALVAAEAARLAEVKRLQEEEEEKQRAEAAARAAQAARAAAAQRAAEQEAAKKEALEAAAVKKAGAVWVKEFKTKHTQWWKLYAPLLNKPGSDEVFSRCQLLICKQGLTVIKAAVSYLCMRIETPSKKLPAPQLRDHLDLPHPYLMEGVQGWEAAPRTVATYVLELVWEMAMQQKAQVLEALVDFILSAPSGDPPLADLTPHGWFHVEKEGVRLVTALVKANKHKMLDHLLKTHNISCILRLDLPTMKPIKGSSRRVTGVFAWARELSAGVEVMEVLVHHVVDEQLVGQDTAMLIKTLMAEGYPPAIITKYMTEASLTVMAHGNFAWDTEPQPHPSKPAQMPLPALPPKPQAKSTAKAAKGKPAAAAPAAAAKPAAAPAAAAKPAAAPAAAAKPAAASTAVVPASKPAAAAAAASPVGPPPASGNYLHTVLRYGNPATCLQMVKDALYLCKQETAGITDTSVQMMSGLYFVNHLSGDMSPLTQAIYRQPTLPHLPEIVQLLIRHGAMPISPGSTCSNGTCTCPQGHVCAFDSPIHRTIIEVGSGRLSAKTGVAAIKAMMTSAAVREEDVLDRVKPDDHQGLNVLSLATVQPVGAQEMVCTLLCASKGNGGVGGGYPLHPVRPTWLPEHPGWVTALTLALTRGPHGSPEIAKMMLSGWQHSWLLDATHPSLPLSHLDAFVQYVFTDKHAREVVLAPLGRIPNMLRAVLLVSHWRPGRLHLRKILTDPAAEFRFEGVCALQSMAVTSLTVSQVEVMLSRGAHVTVEQHTDGPVREPAVADRKQTSQGGKTIRTAAEALEVTLRSALPDKAVALAGNILIAAQATGQGSMNAQLSHMRVPLSDPFTPAAFQKVGPGLVALRHWLKGVAGRSHAEGGMGSRAVRADVNGLVAVPVCESNGFKGPLGTLPKIKGVPKASWKQKMLQHTSDDDDDDEEEVKQVQKSTEVADKGKEAAGGDAAKPPPVPPFQFLIQSLIRRCNPDPVMTAEPLLESWFYTLMWQGEHPPSGVQYSTCYWIRRLVMALLGARDQAGQGPIVQTHLPGMHLQACHLFGSGVGAEQGVAELLRVLLKSGAVDPNERDPRRFGAPLLYLAAADHAHDAVAVLLEAGADPAAQILPRHSCVLDSQVYYQCTETSTSSATSTPGASPVKPSASSPRPRSETASARGRAAAVSKPLWTEGKFGVLGAERRGSGVVQVSLALEPGSGSSIRGTAAGVKSPCSTPRTSLKRGTSALVCGSAGKAPVVWPGRAACQLHDRLVGSTALHAAVRAQVQQVDEAAQEESIQTLYTPGVWDECPCCGRKQLVKRSVIRYVPALQSAVPVVQPLPALQTLQSICDSEQQEEEAASRQVAGEATLKLLMTACPDLVSTRCTPIRGITSVVPAGLYLNTPRMEPYKAAYDRAWKQVEAARSQQQ